MKKLSRYLINKLSWASQFSRSKYPHAIYEGKKGRYIMEKNYDVYFYPYNGKNREFLTNLSDYADLFPVLFPV